MYNAASHLGLNGLPLSHKQDARLMWVMIIYLHTYGVQTKLKVIPLPEKEYRIEMFHYVNVSVHIKFSRKTSVFTLIIVSSP